jgi:hypothetical protein
MKKHLFICILICALFLHSCFFVETDKTSEDTNIENSLRISAALLDKSLENTRLLGLYPRRVGLRALGIG